MKKLLIYCFAIISISSCSILDYNFCKKYVSDETHFRAYSQAIGINSQLAQEKALLLAKQEITIVVDEYIMKKFNHQTFLADPDFETKITTARKTILNNIFVVCNKTIPRNKMFKSYVAIEISKDEIDKEVTKRLKEEIR